MEQTVQQVRIDGRAAWLKRYGRQRRVLRLRAMDLLARRLGVPALRPPPRHPGQAGRDVEKRRLEELALLQVRVPHVLGHGADCLILSDLGQTLSHRLRQATPQEAGALVASAATAIARVHKSGGYLGAPMGRNIAIDSQGCVGFLDFEEDPGEVMPLAQAQARDWLLFVAGVARHAPLSEDELSTMLAPSLREGPRGLREALGAAVARLSFLRGLARWPFRGAASLGKAVGSLQRAVRHSASAFLLAVLAADLLGDGRLELLLALADWID